jgi:hypothetical protein
VTRIQFYTPLGHCEPFAHGEPFVMDLVPRQGEQIMFEDSGYEYLVYKVCYTPNESDWDVYVALR